MKYLSVRGCPQFSFCVYIYSFLFAICDSRSSVGNKMAVVHITTAGQYHTSLSLPLLNVIQWSDIFAIIVFLVRTTLCKLGFRCFVFHLVKVLEKFKSWAIIRGNCNERTQYLYMIDNGCLLSLCQNETIYVNMCSLYRLIFMQIKQIFIWKVLSEERVTFWGTRQVRNGLFFTNDIEGTPRERPSLWSLSQICASIKVYVNFPEKTCLRLWNSKIFPIILTATYNITRSPM